MSRISTNSIIKVALFTALMVAGAYIKIPLPIMPLTFQLAFAVLSGVLLGARKAALAMGLYIVLGLFGLPVFSGGGGLSYIVSPSFGYILGFVAAAIVAGKRQKKLLNVYIFSFLALLAGYAVGVPYQYLILRFYRQNAAISFWATLGGMLIFLLGDILKVIILSPIAIKIKKHI